MWQPRFRYGGWRPAHRRARIIRVKGRRKVIFVHGCFWHRHPDCALARLPKTRHDFWVPKLEANRERDTKILARLKDEGWLVLVIWECELGDLAPLTARIDQFLKEAS